MRKSVARAFATGVSLVGLALLGRLLFRAASGNLVQDLFPQAAGSWHSDRGRLIIEASGPSARYVHRPDPSAPVAVAFIAAGGLVGDCRLRLLARRRPGSPLVADGMSAAAGQPKAEQIMEKT